MRGAWATALWLLAAASPPVLAGTEPLADGMRRCASEADAGRRLACFDALTSALPKLEADQFGMTADIARKRDPESARAGQSDILEGRIAALRSGPGDVWIFTLDNAQIWLQVEPQPSVRYAVGEAVRIEHGAMSSLWLVADKHRKTRVKRLE